MDIKAELETVGRLRRLMEPLAVLYEKTVPGLRFEVRMSVRESADCPRDNDGAAVTIHIMDAETLQAAYEVWQEYRRIERALLEQKH